MLYFKMYFFSIFPLSKTEKTKPVALLFILFQSKKLTDYILCKSNVVLKIDDLQPLFSDQGGNPFIYLNFYELFELDVL